MKKKLLLLALLISVSFFSNHANAAEGDNTLTQIMEESFGAFTEGSESAPASIDISITPTSYNNKLGQILTSWKGKYVYEAGGMLKVGNNGNLQTQKYDMSANGGIVKVTLKVKSLASYGGIIKCQLGYNTAEQTLLTDGEWHTISLIMEKGNSSTYLKIEPFLMAEGFLIDNLKVETSPLLVKAPIANQPSIATATSFTATWSKVTGATGYLLDVYTKGEDETKNYLLKNEVVTTNSRKVEGLLPDNIYFYTVRTQKGEAISDPSNEIEVVEVITSIEAPIANSPTNVTTKGFTANWQKHNKASYYKVLVNRTETITENKEVVCLFEDFSGIKAGTVSNPAIGDYTQEYLDAYTKLPGWYAVFDCYAEGHIGIYPYASAGNLSTPDLDLSHNNGQFTITAKMGEFLHGTALEGASIDIILMTEDEELEKQSVALKKGFNDYTFTFTHGAKNVYVGIVYGGVKQLLIDEVTVKQTMKAGDKFASIVAIQETDETQHEFNTEYAAGVAYSYQVRAYAKTVVDGEIDFLASALSEPMEVILPSSTDSEHTGAQPVIYANNGVLTVQLSQPEKIEVYSTAGSLISVRNGQLGNNSFYLYEKTIIVKVGTQSFKVVL